jgi:hypothetical protein
MSEVHLDNIKKVVELRKRIADLEAEIAALVPAANEDFKTLNRVPAMVDGCLIKRNVPRATWEFPDFIVTAEIRLKKDKDQAKKDGSAHKTDGKIDPTKTLYFSVTLPNEVTDDGGLE